MNDLTKPSMMLGYANTVGIAASTIYMVNKTSALNVKFNDLSEDVETIRDGIKEKVPVIENNIKNLDQNIRGIVNFSNSQVVPLIKKSEKSEKKLDRYRSCIEEMAATIEALDARYHALVQALKDNKILENFKVEDIPEYTPPKPQKKAAPKKKRSLTLSSSDDSSSESSEEEKPKSRKNKSKNHSKLRVDDGDDSETNIVARMASSRRK
jgi:hypothetical protein